MPLKIIYLDDEPELLELFVEEFSSPEVEIRTFSDPQTAVEEIKNNPPDILFIDFQLPGTTGEKIAESLDPALPKFLITGNLSTKAQTQFVEVFEKPIDFRRIGEVIKSYIAKKP